MVQKVIFLHIPKTAGTSVVRLMQKNYGPASCFGLYDQESFERDFTRAMADEQVKALYGHFFFQPDLNTRADNVYLFTFLRDPHAWQVSNYLHIKYSSDAHHQAWFANWKSFGEYLKDKQANNRQTRMISGIMPYKSFAANLPLALEQAKKNLSSMEAVGISEHFGKSIKDIAAKLGWQHRFVPKENVNRHRLEAWYLLRRYRKELQRVCQYDQQLYEFAKEKFLKA